MATSYHTLHRDRWNTVLRNHEALLAAAAAVVDQPPSHSRERILMLYAAATDELLSVPARTLGDVRHKLELYWGDLFEEVYGIDFKQIVIGDLVRLELLLAGVDAEEASGGMDLEKVSSEWLSATREYDSHMGDDRQDAGTHFMMLAMPAPDIRAIEKKLLAIWADATIDPVYDSTAHLHILSDLRRLIARQQQ